MLDHIKPIDPIAERRKRRLLIGAAFAILLSGYLYYEFKNYPEERQVRRFFQALEQKDYQEAYRIWQPSRYYTFKDFSQDWGPGSPEGAIQEFHVTGSNARGSGVVVRVQINGREIVSLWVEKKDKSLSFPP